jgi:hypothetical protein
VNRFAFGGGILSLLAAVIVLSPRDARADEVEVAPATTWRLGLVPSIGAGVAHLSNNGPFPSTIGFTVIGGEVNASLARAGLFARIGFLSSGQDGRWTASTYALGGSYRIFGDGYSSFGLVARGSLLFELWRASTGGCDVGLFFPTNCKDFVPPPGSGITNPEPPRIDVSTDTLGITGGVRFELPVKPIYVAIDAEVAAVASLEPRAPGTIFQLQSVLVFALRHRRAGAMGVDPSYRPRAPRGTSY